MFAVEIHEAAVVELEALNRFDRNRILDEIEEQLTQEPTRLTRRKKVLEALEPPWDRLGPVWQLSVGDYRVFYDVLDSERRVIVRAVRRKAPRQTTERTLRGRKRS